jgi:hypothetical protein
VQGGFFGVKKAYVIKFELNHSRDQDVDGRIILKFMQDNYVLEM